MDGVAKRELTEVEMILGKGMLYDSSGLTTHITDSSKHN